MLLDVAQDGRVGPEGRHVDERAVRDVDAAPAQVDAAAPAGPRVVADDRGNDLQPVRARRPERVVDRLERPRVELPEARLDAEVAADRVSHGLAADDSGAQLPGGGQRVVDLVMARVVRPGRIERSVPGQAEPFDVRAAEAEGPAGELEPRAGARHERTCRLLRGRRRGGCAQQGDQERAGRQAAMRHGVVLPADESGCACTVA